MPPKINVPTAAAKAPAITANLPRLHDVANQTVSANADSRRRLLASQSAAGAANHARHHVSRQSQS